MNKRIFLLIFATAVLASCQREQDWRGAPDINAAVESEQNTRTSISVDESGAGTIYWNPSDKIDVFFGTKKAQYTSQNAYDAIAATFKTSAILTDSDVSSTNIWGLYPSNSSSSCNGSSITTTLPSTQYGVPNTFDENIFPAVAHSSSTTLQFYNVCGGIKFSLYRDDIASITFRGNNNENIAGTVSISFVSGVPKATITSGVKEITLTPKTGTKFVKDAYYYIALLPGTLSNGFTMTFTTTNGTVGTLNYTDNSVTIRRSVFSRKDSVDVYAGFGDGRQPNNVIYYTSAGGQVVTPYKTDVFGANIVSNEYVGGRGIITFDGDVTSIGSHAFYNLRGLTSGYMGLISIEIPNSVTSIGDFAFSYCYGLNLIEIPNSVTSIGESAFGGCISLISIEIPNSVTSIGYGTFWGCSGLTSIELPNSLSSIGDHAFEDCIRLTSIEIPNSVTRIGIEAFSHCIRLTSIEIPNSVTSIGAYAFSYCEALSSIIVENGNPVYDSRNGCNAIINTSMNALDSGCKNTIIPNSVRSIFPGAFLGCSGLTSIVIPNSVTSIDFYAFWGCSGLTSIVIPNSVTSIESNPFSECNGLSSIIVENGNPVYDSRNGCNAIIKTSTNELVSGCKNTIIPNSVTSIRPLAFYICSGLTSIKIPNSVTSIGGEAFSGCSDLTSIIVYALTPPALEPNVFTNTDNCPIYVPAQSVNAYKTADGWSEYADRIQAIPDTHEAVDLGLSVKWATCNVGADTPEGYGDYFAWGETEPKSDYSWSTYKWCNGTENTLTKYCNLSSYGYDGFMDFILYLEQEDDAAHVNWGGFWRMPTVDEWTELRSNCTWTWTTQNGVNGYRVTSNKTGYTEKSIFLPAAGWSLSFGGGTYGDYWATSIPNYNPSNAFVTHFESSYYDYSAGDRCDGLSIRPVTE